MEKALKNIEVSVERFMQLMDETEEKIARTDGKLRDVRRELEPLETEILTVTTRLRDAEQTLHRKLAKAKRIRKLYLNAATEGQRTAQEKDYDRLMKEIHKLDKAIAEMKERVAKLQKKEEKLLDREMELEAKKAELYHARDGMMREASRIIERLGTKIRRAG